VTDSTGEDSAGKNSTGKDSTVAWIDLDGAVNVRDLGALPAGDGHTAAGRLIRGDNLQDLSPADVRRLVDDIGLTTVVDLRSPYEVGAEGPGPLTRVASVRHLYHSLLPEQGTATDAAAGGGPPDDQPRGQGPASVAADALAIRRRDAATALSPDDVRVGYYLGYLQDRPDQVVAALRGIARSPGAALVHCAAGKDRTGVVVALALTVAGVRRDAIIADYAVTAERMHAVLGRLRASPTYAEDTNSRPDNEHMPSPQTMAAFLDYMNTEYGGVLAWLGAHGFGPDDVAALRAKLRDH
jgi:protein tyrosine/serine phosphatase